MFDSRNVPNNVLDVCADIEAHGFQAWVVGGCVRDPMLGRKPNDWDVATDAAPEKVVTFFPKVIPTGIQHGTVTVVTPSCHVEVTTFRGDGDYSDGRRPDSVTFVKTIEQDLARRDFTINAMAYRPKTNSFVDPFNGKLDLECGLIRAVGNPAFRFAEDGLRTMRACRFAAQLNFKLGWETKAAIPGAIETFRKVAKERVTTEFLKLVNGFSAKAGLEAMRDTGLWSEVFPGVDFDEEAVKNLGWFRDESIKLAVLLRSAKYDTYSVLGNLVLPTAQRSRVASLVTGYWNALNIAAREEVGHYSCRSWAAEVGRPRYQDVMTMLLCFGQAEEFVLEAGRALVGDPALTIGELALNGEEVCEILGVKPGREVGEALRHLLDAVLANPELNKPHRLTMLLLKK